MLSLKPGDAAPDFKIIDTTGKTVTLKDLKGKKHRLNSSAICKVLPPLETSQPREHERCKSQKRSVGKLVNIQPGKDSTSD